jgi:NAD(P)-dependent dehydrogenase (short-subunit alcohol dehydrogenase family)
MERIAGKVAFVSGGASGIGLAMASSLARAGARVSIGDIDPGALAAAAEALRGIGATVSTAVLDVANPDAWEDAATRTERELGPVSILCNNAGVGPKAGDVTQSSVDDWNWVLDINLGGVFLGSRAFGARMKAAGQGGHIVNTASILGLFPSGQVPAYVASKFAVVGLSEAMRIDLAPHGIGVSVLCPGFVHTPLRETSRRHRPSAAAEQQDGGAALPPRPSAMQPSAVGDAVVDAIRHNRLYVLTHADYREAVADRMGRILDGFGPSAEPGYVEDTATLAGASLALTKALGGV